MISQIDLLPSVVWHMNLVAETIMSRKTMVSWDSRHGIFHLHDCFPVGVSSYR